MSVAPPLSLPTAARRRQRQYRTKRSPFPATILSSCTVATTHRGGGE
ncbi:MAG: hypothetical protein AVDCRST_MAG18-2677 [uncultured Thermomicrobiales bacterium]|uniref:Uncharacterized protein n=1 Tax=uncultured Thermomicrobiales bacterium TaxID=1645740 RepID=A0A6J4VLP4_9BACT|nr:MAG: hypothetical protein AVDCRST_MAG18-2677 [uncultured Thermomicrobiales bacterium]